MADASLAEIAEQPRKPPGRKPGCAKVPGSGRKVGGKNKVPRDLKELILLRGKPLELLCDISRGVKIRVGPQAGPGAPTYVYPSLQERAAAAVKLIDKLIPAAPAVPPSPDQPDAAQPAMSDFDLARMIAFSLAKGVDEAEAAAPSVPAPRPAAAPPTPPEPIEAEPDPVAQQRLDG